MSKKYIPEKVNIMTSVDDIGAMVDLQRISGEDLFSYKKRILESSQRIANSSYSGLMNGINRELGLERKKIIEVDLKKILTGDIDYQGISYSNDVITDTRTYTDTIDGVNVIAVGSKLTVTGADWDDGELVGLTLSVDGTNYLIESNDQENAYVKDGEMSSLVGEIFNISLALEDNSIAGLGLYLGKSKYLVLENTLNSIKVDRDINIESGTNYHLAANTPRIHITSSRIILYKEYVNEENYQLDAELFIRESNMLHNDVVSWINSTSRFFIAEDLIPLEDSVSSFLIMQQDSDHRVFKDKVPGAKYFRLENQNIKNGSVKFSETNVFFREASDIGDAPEGPYYFIDYKQGIVRSKIIPNGIGDISYVYMEMPFKLECTPVVITSFSDKESDKFLYAQKEKILYEDGRDRYISTQPKSKMIEYVAELLAVNEQNWGE